MITGISVFKFIEGKGDEALAYLEKHADWGKQQKGCLGSYVSRSIDDPDYFFLYSNWENLDAHNNVSRVMRDKPEIGERFLKIMELLEIPPVLGRFVVREGGKATEEIDESQMIRVCKNCKMPMIDDEDFAGGDRNSELCVHCG